MSTPLLLDPENYEDLYLQYIKSKLFFPLISAVLERKQNGLVFVNNTNSPSSFFIIHKFGFAQFFEIEEDPVFERSIIEYLTTINTIEYLKCNKLRVYGTDGKWSNYFSALDNSSFVKTTRCRMLYQKNMVNNTLQDEHTTLEVDDENFEQVSSAFDLHLDKRFWHSKEDFLSNGLAMGAVTNGKFVSICYAAAVSNNLAEVDIFTSEDNRNKGYARKVLSAFIHRCESFGITPCWDCYKNNLASYTLASEMNFYLKFEYDFYIIDLSEKN